VRHITFYAHGIKTEDFRVDHNTGAIVVEGIALFMEGKTRAEQVSAIRDVGLAIMQQADKALNDMAAKALLADKTDTIESNVDL
jgi:hypothetical protein